MAKAKVENEKEMATAIAEKDEELKETRDISEKLRDELKALSLEYNTKMQGVKLLELELESQIEAAKGDKDWIII